MNFKDIQKTDFIKLFVTQRWLWHVCLWITYFLLQSPNYIYYEHQPTDFWEIMLLQDFFTVLMSYVIIIVFFSLLYNKRKYILFILSIIVNALLFSLLVSFLINDRLNEYIIKISSLPKVSLFETFSQGISFSLLFSVFIVIAKISKGYFIANYYENQKKKMQVHSELNNLKAQLSPHFLFNTMNNFYGLSVQKSDKLPDLMLRLSDLLRYSLYETKKETVSVENEISYLKNYIELEKIRLESNLKLVFNYSNPTQKNHEIAPLLLIVFVENAFKHSKNSLDEVIFICIDIQIDTEDWLCLKVDNTFANSSSNELVSIGGIGIENVKKRLEVLYPNELHSLQFTSDNSKFSVDLRIKLTQNKIDND